MPRVKMSSGKIKHFTYTKAGKRAASKARAKASKKK